MSDQLAPGLRAARSRIHGIGCFATCSFRPHQKIAEYVGERISLAEAELRRSLCTDCICDVDVDWAIDGSRGGNVTQYINHSCQPNAYVIVSEARIFILALREIAAGDEITTDYLYELTSEEIKCRCGTSACHERRRAQLRRRSKSSPPT